MMIRKTHLPAILALALMFLAGAGCSKEARKARLDAKAKVDFDALQYDKAEIEYRDALRIPPLDAESIGQLGILYYNEGRTLEAFKYLHKGIELDPKNTELHLKLGLAELALGDFKDSLEEAKKVVADRPDDQEAWLMLVASCRSGKALEDAQALLDNAAKQGGDQASYHLGRGLIQRVKRDAAGAEAEFTKALALDPKSASAYLELANLAYARQDAKTAGQDYKSASDLSPLRSVRRMTYIDFRIRNGELDEAKKMLADLNRDAPDYIPALVETMKLAFAEQKYDDCAADIQKILARDPMNLDALTQRGDLKLALGDNDGAIEAYKRADDTFKRIPQIKLDLAVAQMRNGDAAAAEDSLTQALAFAPNFDPAVLLLAEVNIRKGNPAAAVSILTQLIKKRPNMSRAYTLLAEAYQSQKNPGQALAVYARMAEKEPKNPQIPFLAGLIWAQESQWDKARKSFEDSLAIAPNYGPALEKLVDLDLMQRRPDAAAVRIDTLMKKYPDAAALFVLRAKIRGEQKNLDGAEADLVKATELDPKLQTAYLMLARIYVHTNKYQQAIDKLTVLAAKTNSITAMMELGLLQFDLKHYDDARAAYERLLAVNPKYTPALNNLAYLYCEKLGRLDQALELAKNARKYAPEDPTSADTLGWILFKKGEYHSALALLQESADSEPSNSEIQYHLGMAHYMLGEEDLARVAFEHATAAGAEFPSRDEALHRLALLKLNGPAANPAMVAELENQVRANPNDPVALVRLAEIQQRNGLAEKAAANYESALALNPRDVRIMLQLAQLYSGPLKNLPKAREMAKGAHELAPDDPQISETLGRMLYETGDYKWSLTLLEEAARTNSNQPALSFDLAKAYYSVGRVADASTALQGVLQTDASPDRKREAMRLSSMIAAEASPSDALASLPEAQRILETDPDYVPALMVTALAQEKQGNPSGASQTYQKILSEYHDFSPAIRQLALIIAQRADDDKRAFDLATTALDAYPNDPQLARAIGILDYRRDDYTSAVHFLQESQAQQPNDPEIFYYLGMSHYKLKETSAAKTELQRALDSNIPDQEADEAKRVLDELKGATAPSLSEQPIN